MQPRTDRQTVASLTSVAAAAAATAYATSARHWHRLSAGQT